MHKSVTVFSSMQMWEAGSTTHMPQSIADSPGSWSLMGMSPLCPICRTSGCKASGLAANFRLHRGPGAAPKRHVCMQLLEINLVTNPAVADAIMSNGTLTHYDRPRIAQLCEKAALYMRALQHYTDLPDIKRVIINTHAIDPQQLVEYFGSLSADWAIDCLKVGRRACACACSRGLSGDVSSWAPSHCTARARSMLAFYCVTF